MRNQDYSILIRELKAGKESAFDSLFRLFYQDLCRFACSFLNDPMCSIRTEVRYSVIVRCREFLKKYGPGKSLSTKASNWIIIYMSLYVMPVIPF